MNSVSDHFLFIFYLYLKSLIIMVIIARMSLLPIFGILISNLYTYKLYTYKYTDYSNYIFSCFNSIMFFPSPSSCFYLWLVPFILINVSWISWVCNDLYSAEGNLSDFQRSSRDKRTMWWPLYFFLNTLCNELLANCLTDRSANFRLQISCPWRSGLPLKKLRVYSCRMSCVLKKWLAFLSKDNIRSKSGMIPNIHMEVVNYSKYLSSSLP